MGANLNDTHLFEALDAYPYNLSEAIESLNYALSYDNKNTLAICLKGRIYAEQLKDYEQAKLCYEEALAVDIHALEVYPNFILTLIWNEDYDQAQKLIDFAMTIKGMDKALIHLRQAMLFESLHQLKEAKKAVKKAVLSNFDADLQLDIQEVHNRIKDKVKLLSGKKSKINKETKKKKKVNKKKK